MKLFHFFISVVACYLLVVTPILAQEDATTPGKSVRDQLRERIEQRLQDLQNKPRAFIGKITDMPSSSLLIETQQGTRQIKLTDKTVIVGTKNNQKTTLKEKDLQIGNIIVAMGYQNTKDILDAQRILILEELPNPQRRAVYGIVDSITKDTLVIKHPKTGDLWTIKTNSKTRVTAKISDNVQIVSFSDIQASDRLVAIGIPVKNGVNTLTARLIHVIPGKANGITKKASPSPSASPTAKPKASPQPTP